jgi:cyclase
LAVLKNRLIPVLFLRNGFLVRSESFSIHQNLGNPVAQVERYNSWDVDELIYIDISEHSEYSNQRSDLGDLRGFVPRTIDDIITIVAGKCFMPLTFGGGIRTTEDARRRFAQGADKITINSQALREPELITSLAKEFGSQAIVVSIDARAVPTQGHHMVYTAWGREATGRKAADWARETQERGAGEILINSIDRDGKATGYDLELVRSVVEVTSIPVIACGGAGNYGHFADAIRDGGAAAAAAGNIFHFKELAYPMAKRQLKKAGLNVR